MKYTVENFKKEGLATKITPIEYMIAKKDGLVETDKGSMNVLKGDYICKGSDRVWMVDAKYFNDNYKQEVELSNDELSLLYIMNSGSAYPGTYKASFNIPEVLKSLEDKKCIKTYIGEQDQISFKITKEGVKRIKEIKGYAKEMKNLDNSYHN